MDLSEHNDTTPPTDRIDDSAALEAGLVGLMPYLRAFAQSLSGSRDLAEDLAQEAFAKAWRARQSFAPGSNLKAWVFTILRNEFYSYRRRAGRQDSWDAERPKRFRRRPRNSNGPSNCPTPPPRCTACRTCNARR